MNGLHERFAGRTLWVATMHGKEAVIGPPLMQALGLKACVPLTGLNTDRLGAFSGEVLRREDPRSTAIAKAKLGAEHGQVDLVVASEGSFGPYPPSPFMPCDEEFLVLYDARDQAIYEHRHLSLQVVFGGAKCSTMEEVFRFAEGMKFPSHGLLLRPSEKWKPGDPIEKGIRTVERLRNEADKFIGQYGQVWVETDQRAMMNPTRMEVIAECARRFAGELQRTCPSCCHFFFRVTGTRIGLPCESCNWPTESIRSYIRECVACGHQEQEARPDGKRFESPQFCGNCNP